MPGNLLGVAAIIASFGTALTAFLSWSNGRKANEAKTSNDAANAVILAKVEGVQHTVNGNTARLVAEKDASAAAATSARLEATTLTTAATLQANDDRIDATLAAAQAAAAAALKATQTIVELRAELAARPLAKAFFPPPPHTPEAQP